MHKDIKENAGGNDDNNRAFWALCLLALVPVAFHRVFARKQLDGKDNAEQVGQLIGGDCTSGNKPNDVLPDIDRDSEDKSHREEDGDSRDDLKEGTANEENSEINDVSSNEVAGAMPASEITILMRRTAGTSYNAIGLSQITFYASDGSAIPILKANGEVYLREINENSRLAITRPSCGQYSNSYGFLAAFGSTGYGYLSSSTLIGTDYVARINVPDELLGEIKAVSVRGRSTNSSPGICGFVRLQCGDLIQEASGSGPLVRLELQNTL